MTQAPEFVDGRARTLWQEAREQAAFLGAFNPLDLVGKLNDQAVLEALSALSTECTEVFGDGRTRWQMSADARRRIFDALNQQGRLVEAAQRAPAPDNFARYLQSALEGHLEIPTQSTLADLEVARNAAQFAAPYSLHPSWKWPLRAAVAERNAEAVRQWLLPKRLIGRDRELDRMQDFVHAGLADTLQTRGDWALVVTGASGVGKSALLAEFKRSFDAEAGVRVPMLWLDFDRAALSEPTPTILLIEIARQIAVAVPASRQSIEYFIERALNNAGPRSFGTFSQESADESRIWSIWREYVSPDWSQQPLLLILDTLEEVTIHRDGRAEQLAGWLRALIFESGLANVRVILSGRPDDDRMRELLGGGCIKLVVRNLRKSAAVQLLDTHLADAGITLDRALANDLVGHYGGNPLSLKIMARYIETWGVASAPELLEDAGSERLAADMAQKILYTRILGRVRTDDPDLCKLAHPGLVLRRVTPDLIQRVLAGPCNLGPITQTRAIELFDALRSQIWLVDGEIEAGAVRHRRDLRRLVFAAMNKAEAARTRDIHRAARDYYLDRKDIHLTARAQEIEVQYHRAFLEPETFSNSELGDLVSNIGEDAVDLPASMRGRAKLLSGRGLANEEYDALSDDEKFAHSSITERNYRRRARQPAPPSSSSLVERAPGLVADRAFSEGDVDRVISLGPQLVEEFVRLLQDDSRQRDIQAEDFTSYGVWRVAMLTRGDPAADDLLASLEYHLEQSRVEWSAPLNRSSKQWFSRGEAINCLRMILGARLDEDFDFYPVRRRSRQELFSVQELRYHQLILRDYSNIPERTERLRIGLILFAYMSPDWRQLDEGHRPPGIDVPPDIRFFLSDRAARGQRSSLADALIDDARRAFIEVDPRSGWSKMSQNLIRGTTPEFHPLFQAWLREESDKALLDFAGGVAGVRMDWPVELTPQSLGRSLALDRERWIGTLIEVADRFALLPRLLVELGHNSSEGEPVHRLQHMFRGYDAALGGHWRIEI